ncbi:MAG: DUF1499 domain-containing protein [Acetobacteraceae bacterium]
MNPIAWLVGLVLPACGAVGAAGLPTPQPMDMAAIVRPSSPNTALAAPAGFKPTPDIVTQPYHVAPLRLFAAIRAVAQAQPRVFVAAVYPDRLQVHYVVRSAVFNFPDLVTVAIDPVGDDTATLTIYSRSVYGHSDLGVNRARIETWLQALQTELHQDHGR